MSFNGNEGGVITLTEGAKLTANYRNAHPGNPNLVLGSFMGIKQINKILEQPGCVGIRTYYGLTDRGVKQIVMVGVNADENDLYEGIILDLAHLCPPNCSVQNPLNSAL